MSRINFITEEQLKSLSNINSNVDNEYLTNQIWYVQQRFLRPLLGDDLYSEIESQFIASAISTSNQTLIDKHITPFLVNQSAAEILPILSYKVDNIGVHNRSDTNFNPISHTEIDYLASQYKNQAAFFAEQMTKYLYQYQDDYPKYLNGNLTIDKISANTNTKPNSAFYLGRSNRRIYNKGRNDC